MMNKNKNESVLYYYTKDGKQFVSPSLDIAVKRSESNTIRIETRSQDGSVEKKIVSIES